MMFAECPKTVRYCDSSRLYDKYFFAEEWFVTGQPFFFVVELVPASVVLTVVDAEHSNIHYFVFWNLLVI